MCDPAPFQFEHCDASKCTTEISALAAPLPGAASARWLSPLLGSRSPVPSPPTRLRRLGDYDDVKECKHHSSFGLDIVLLV